MPSAIDPLNPAMSRVGKICFRPFNLGRWFAIGFMAFLAGATGGGLNFPNPFSSRSSSGFTSGNFHQIAQNALDWVGRHINEIIIIGGIILIVWLCFIALMSWLRCRAKFVFIDQIVKHHANVVHPWKAHAMHAHSLFMFTIVLGTIMCVVYMGALILMVVLGWPAIKAAEFNSHAWVALGVGAAITLPCMFISSIVFAIVDKILVPVMYFHGVGIVHAYRIFKKEMLPGNLGSIALFLLMKLAIGVGVGIVSMIVGLVGCCVCAFLPYLNTVASLPAHVFTQTYDLLYVASFFGNRFPMNEPQAGFPITDVSPVTPPPIPPQQPS